MQDVVNEKISNILVRLKALLKERHLIDEQITHLLAESTTTLKERNLNRPLVLLEEVGFTARVLKALRSEGFTHLNDIEYFKETDLRSIPNLGKLSFNEILFQSRRRGIELGSRVPEGREEYQRAVPRTRCGGTFAEYLTMMRAKDR